MASNKKAAVVLEPVSSFHDVTVLSEPLLPAASASDDPPRPPLSQSAATVRILKFGFTRSESHREGGAAYLRGLATSTWRKLPPMSDLRSLAVSLVPCLDWMLSYDVRRDLKGDVAAGLSVGFMIIPQGMAYARVANLPSIYGLYTGFVPCLLYSIFGSSRQLALGPTSLVSLLVGEAIKQLANPDDPADVGNYLALTLLLSFLMGAVQLLAGVVRLGWTVRFLSHAVVSGFSSGAAIILGVTQMRYFMGYRTRHETIHMIIYDIVCNLKSIHYPSLIMGSLSLVFLLVMKHLGKTHKKLRALRSMGPILGAAIATLIIFLCGNPWGIRVTGEVPQGLPAPFLKFPWERWQELVTPTLVIASASYLESIGIAKTLAAKNGYSVDANQELVGLGIANLVGACFQAYPTGGSFSRSAVSDDCGAKTGMAGIVSVLLVLFTLIFLTPIFQYLPLPLLGAILLNSVAGLVDHEEARFLWRVDKKDFAVWTLAFCGTLFFGIEVGVMVAVLLSLGFVINESANAQCEVLGRLPGTTVYRSVEQYPDAKVTPGIAVIKFHSHLYFANVMNLRDSLRQYENLRGSRATPKWPASETEPLSQTSSDSREGRRSSEGAAELSPSFLDDFTVKFVIVDMTSVHAIDGAACHALKEITAEYQARGIRLALANPSAAVMEKLEQAGIPDLIGRQWFFVRVYDAVKLCRAYMAMAAQQGGPTVTALGQSPSAEERGVLLGQEAIPLPLQRGMPPELEWRKCRGGGTGVCKAKGEEYALPSTGPRIDPPVLAPQPGSQAQAGISQGVPQGKEEAQQVQWAVPVPLAVDLGMSLASVEDRPSLSDEFTPPLAGILQDGAEEGPGKSRARRRQQKAASGAGNVVPSLRAPAPTPALASGPSPASMPLFGGSLGPLHAPSPQEGLLGALLRQAAASPPEEVVSPYVQSAPDMLQSGHVLVEEPEETAWVRGWRARGNGGSRRRGGGAHPAAEETSAAHAGEKGQRERVGLFAVGSWRHEETDDHSRLCEKCKGILSHPDGRQPLHQQRLAEPQLCSCQGPAPGQVVP